MEHRDIDTLKTLLGVLTSAEVAEFEGHGIKVKFHRALPLVHQAPTARAAVTPPGIPPAYAGVFPQGFPTHAPPKDTPKAE